MDAAEFISLAVRLWNSAREADLRTAASRAYYGSFHLAREFVEQCGIHLSGKELYKTEVHQKVRYCLGASGSEEAELIAEKLGSLRELRNEADYDLNSPNYRDPTLVGVAVRTAHDIVDGLQRCGRERAFSRLREKMAAYARDVLRLQADE